jgi:hypothetical protein
MKTNLNRTHFLLVAYRFFVYFFARSFGIGFGIAGLCWYITCTADNVRITDAPGELTRSLRQTLERAVSIF